MNHYDVLLINPYWSKLNASLEHLGLGYMASYLRQRGYRVKLLDFTVKTVSLEDTIVELEKNNPSIIGISLPFQEAAKEALDFIKRLRSLNVKSHINVGGIYPTFAHKEILNLYPEIDSITLGEGEITFFELTEKIVHHEDWHDVKSIAFRRNDQITKSELRPLIDDLDDLPFPARDTLPDVLKNLNFASMITSRGCYGRCSFCSVDSFYSDFGPKYRLRSKENVMEEIERLYQKHHVKNIMFNDANFIGGKGHGYDRAMAIAEDILHKNIDLEFRIQCRANDVDRDLFMLLKQAGLSRVYLGIESGSQTMLDRFQKDITVKQNIEAVKVLSSLDIFISIGFIMFDDQTNIDELKENISFIKELKKSVPKSHLGHIYPMSKVLPLSGTKVERDMKQHNKLIGNSLDYSYKFDDPTIHFIYKNFSSLSGLVWKIKDLFNIKPNANKEWIGGWRKY